MQSRLKPYEADLLRAQSVTYAEVGATLGELPPGYRHLEETFALGHGTATFERAAAAVMCWQVQRGAGLRVQASTDGVEEGTVAIVRIGLGPLSLRAPVRVLRVIDQPGRRGFVYGTLPGHPESGEEAFVVELADDDAVVLHIVAFARAATTLSRLGGPVTWFIQRRVTRRYGRALL
ncbi:MAG: DUF1990 family protein [Marmoricola sp.]